MNENQSTDLTEFSKFIRELYGFSDHEVRLNRIKQELSENECLCLSTVTRAFNELKG